MKKRKLLTIVFVCMFLGFVICQKQNVFAAGGTEIYTASDLSKVRLNLAGTYKMMANISLPADFVPIGTADEPFTGKFDGNGFQISNLIIVSEDSDLGFFGYTKGAEIKGLTITGTIQGSSSLGGVIGHADSSTIYNCISNVKVTGANRVGGMIGWLSNGSTVYNCQNNGTVTGTTRCAGGIIGDIYSNSTVVNCANLAEVAGKELVGGITGGSTGGTITNCSNAGKVTGSLNYGAIAGDNGNHAGRRSYTYFRKTNTVNTTYGIIGENSRTYSSSNGSLNEAIIINNKSYTTASKALNAWVSANKTSATKYLPWKLVNNKLELNFNSYSLSISNSNMKLDIGKSENIKYTVKDAKGNVVDKTVKFTSSKQSVAKVSSKGRVVAVGAGVCKITCKVDETSKTVTVIVFPKKVTNITTSKRAKNSLGLKWKKQTGVSGYDIYMYDTDIKEYTKVKSVKGSVNSVTISGLKKGKTCKFKIRAYVKSGSKKYYGKTSAVYKAKTKK